MVPPRHARKQDALSRMKPRFQQVCTPMVPMAGNGQLRNRAFGQTAFFHLPFMQLIVAHYTQRLQGQSVQTSLQ
jgi:hypothetical protein